MARWFSWWQDLPTASPRKAALLSGTLLGLAFPPVSLPWLLWVAWPLLWNSHLRYRHLYGALLLWNLVGCYWLLLTTLSAPDLQEGLLSLVAGAAAILTNPLLMLLPFWAWRTLSRRLGQEPSPWLFIPLWALFEYLHFRWELTWSWLTLGFAWSEWPFWGAMVRLVGPVGLSAWTLIGVAMVSPGLPFGGRWSRFIAGLVWIGGLPALAHIDWLQGSVDAPRTVWALQPNIDPYAKFSELPPDSQVKIVERLLPWAPPQGSLIVGPETAIPLPVSLDHPRQEPWLRPFWRYVERHKVNLLLGVTGYRYFPPGSRLPASARPMPEGGGYELYNAALLLRPDTFFVHIKARLVPFVERAPYLEVFTFLRSWQIDLGGAFGHLGKPDTQQALSLYPDDLPVAVAVCYESIFAHDLRRRLPPKPALLAILTNDGWWKESSGYWQHYRYGQLVAQGLGVPAVRSANTGVSACLTAEGQPLSALPYDTRGSLSAVLVPQAPATPYHRWGESGLLLLGIFALGLWTRSLRYRRSSRLSTR